MSTETTVVTNLLDATRALKTFVDATPNMPPVCYLDLVWSRVRAGWVIDAQLSNGHMNEAESIDAIRTWANAFGLATRLSDIREGTEGRTYRQLSATGALWSLPVTIWTHVDTIDPAAA